LSGPSPRQTETLSFSPRNRSHIPGRGKRLHSSPEYTHRIWGPLNSYRGLIRRR